MDAVQRRRLGRTAWNRATTRDGEERWSFIFRTEDATGYLFYPFSTVEEFDGDLAGLNLAPERIVQIEAGGDLTPEEFAEWRHAYCKRQAETNSDRVWPVWIVPIKIEDQIAAYATFLCKMIRLWMACTGLLNRQRLCCPGKAH